MTDRDMTDLDRAKQRMDGGDDADRLAFYGVLADAPLALWLTAEPQGTEISPVIVEVEGTRCLVAFDDELRLAEVAGGPAAHVTMPGRALVSMLAGQGMGLALNPGDFPSAFLMDAGGIAWLEETLRGLGRGAAEAPRRPVSLAIPAGLDARLLEMLGAKLARAGGMVSAAFLSQAQYQDGDRRLLLSFVGADLRDEPALRDLAAEAALFAGLEEGLDVAFAPRDSDLATRIARAGLRLEVQQAGSAAEAPRPPGTDPDRPPRLR